MSFATEEKFLRYSGGTLTGIYHTERYVTLDTCKSRCLNGEWPDCVAFSRYDPKADPMGRGGDGKRSSCWWTNNRSHLVYRDPACNTRAGCKEALFVLKREGRSARSFGEGEGEPVRLTCERMHARALPVQTRIVSKKWRQLPP